MAFRWLTKGIYFDKKKFEHDHCYGADVDANGAVAVPRNPKALAKLFHLSTHGVDVPAPKAAFPDMQTDGLTPSILSFLTRFPQPTPIQSQAIPTILARRSSIICAPTGSGKTLAYLAPILSLLQAPSLSAPRALIVTPSRDLALQVVALVRDIAAATSTQWTCVALSSYTSTTATHARSSAAAAAPMPGGQVKKRNRSPSGTSASAERSPSADAPRNVIGDVVIGSVQQLAKCCALDASFFAAVQAVVVDEADVVLSGASLVQAITVASTIAASKSPIVPHAGGEFAVGALSSGVTVGVASGRRRRTSAAASGEAAGASVAGQPPAKRRRVVDAAAPSTAPAVAASLRQLKQVQSGHELNTTTDQHKDLVFVFCSATASDRTVSAAEAFMVASAAGATTADAARAAHEPSVLDDGLRVGHDDAFIASATAFRARYTERLVRVYAGSDGAVAAGHVAQQLVYVGSQEGSKVLLLKDILAKGTLPPVLVFVQSASRAEALVGALRPACDVLGMRVGAIHSAMPPDKRDAAMLGVRSGTLHVAVTTDALARGFDAPLIGTVINFDFPPSAAVYVHRVGRTGRAGRSGRAVTFWTDDDVQSLGPIAAAVKRSVEVGTGATAATAVAAAVVKAKASTEACAAADDADDGDLDGEADVEVAHSRAAKSTAGVPKANVSNGHSSSTRVSAALQHAALSPAAVAASRAIAAAQSAADALPEWMLELPRSSRRLRASSAKSGSGSRRQPFAAAAERDAAERIRKRSEKSRKTVASLRHKR